MVVNWLCLKSYKVGMGLIVMLASSCPLHISPTLLNNNNHIPTSVGGTHSELFKYLTNPIKTFNSDNRSGSSSVISSNTRPFLITATAANQQSVSFLLFFFFVVDLYCYYQLEIWLFFKCFCNMPIAWS